MGHNRAGDRRRRRLKRHRREVERLDAMAPRQGEGGAAEAEGEHKSHGILGTVKDVAKSVAETVGGLLHGHSEKTENPAPEGHS